MPIFATPDPRRLRGSAAVCAAIVALAAAPAAGQSLQEAARANVVLAARLCIDVMLRQTPPEQAFGAAGFVYRPVDRGTNDYGVALGIDHLYEAPSDTARVDVDDPAGPNGICTVFTAHMPEAEVRSLAAAIIMQDYPQARVTQQSEMIVHDLSPLPMLVNIRTLTRHRYEAPGTVQLSVSFPG